jgi:hypothetical protein
MQSSLILRKFYLYQPLFSGTITVTPAAKQAAVVVMVKDY